MIKKNIWVLTLLITISSQLYGQAYRGYGGYMLGLWSIEWGKLNNQITDLNVDNFGMGNLENALMTMYDSRLNLSKQVVKEVNGFFKDKLFKTFIHRNVRLSEAPSFGKPALLYDANSTGARNYMSLTEEILQRVS